MGPPAFWYKVLIHMTVGTTFPRKILNNGKEPCEPLMTMGGFHYGITERYLLERWTKEYLMNASFRQ